MTALHTTITALSLSMMIAGSALAGPPLATDDAATVDVGKVELELNGSYTEDRETAFGVTTKCRTADAEVKLTTGLGKNLGISLALPYNINERIKQNDQLVGKSNGFGDMTVELKYVFAELAGISLAVKPTAIIPTGKYSAGLSEGRWQFGGALIATREFEDGKYALHANVGYEHHSYRTEEISDATRSNLWSGSIAGEVVVAKGLTAGVDFGLATTADRSTSQLSACVLGGARYEINDHLDINAGVKLGLTRPEDDLTALYGIVLKF